MVVSNRDGWETVLRWGLSLSGYFRPERGKDVVQKRRVPPCVVIILRERFAPENRKPDAGKIYS